MDSVRGSYENLAGEYYDADRHPTSASLRAASGLAVSPWLRQLGTAGAHVCEVGAGRSLVAEIAPALGSLVISDSSMSMLAQSREAGERGHRLLAEANALPFSDAVLDLLVAILGDPYNDEVFWREVARVLAPGGSAIYTCPSHVWTTRFRTACEPHVAEFDLRDGRRVEVPSFVYPEQQQIAMAAACGLRHRRTQSVALSELGASAAPKLRGLATDDGAVVTGYLFERI